MKRICSSRVAAAQRTAWLLAWALGIGAASAQTSNTEALTRQIVQLRGELATVRRQLEVAQQQPPAAPPNDADRRALAALRSQLDAMRQERDRAIRERDIALKNPAAETFRQERDRARTERDDALAKAKRAIDETNARWDARLAALRRQYDDELRRANEVIADERGQRRDAEKTVTDLRTAQADLQTRLDKAQRETEALKRSVAEERARGADLDKRLAQAQTAASAALTGAAAARSELVDARGRIATLETAATGLQRERWTWAAAAAALGLTLGGALVRTLWRPKPMPASASAPVATPVAVRVQPGVWAVTATAPPHTPHPGFRLRTAWLPTASGVRPEAALIREFVRGPTRSSLP